MKQFVDNLLQMAAVHRQTCLVWERDGGVDLPHAKSAALSDSYLWTALPVLGTVWSAEGGADGLVPLSSSQFYGRDFKSKEKTLLGFPSKPLTLLVSTPLW